MKQYIIIVLLGISDLIFPQNCEKWKVFEITATGPSNGNPFTEISFSAVFTNGSVIDTIAGFYDGSGIYKVRYMPAFEGKWNYATISNNKKVKNRTGRFFCIPPSKGNRGPVVVKDNIYFAYSDGTPHYSFGTTCYAWVHQGDSLAGETLKTLGNGYFNKMRMCIFPLSYNWNINEPLYYPFEGKPLQNWDFTRFNPVYFRNIEKRITQLDSMGIEADLIVFHPYDRWGFQNLDRETEKSYIRYILARFSAYKNVWWSMANEYDFMKSKKMEDWDFYIRYFAENDPYNRLLGIHNGRVWYNHSNPLITHLSIQDEDTWMANQHIKKYNKPAVFDECRYEGNVPLSWGNITAKEMVNKFWSGFTNGGHVGHGETYVTEDPIMLPEKSSDVLWWSKGGILRGESFERIKFLRGIIESSPGFLKYSSGGRRSSAVTCNNEYFLYYYTMDQPRSTMINLPANSEFQVEIIDAWEMTIKPVKGSFSGRCMIELPEKPMIALRITKIK